MSERTFQYIRNHLVKDHERLGWIRHNSLLGTHHGYWSTLMEWVGEDEPVYPNQVDELMAEQEAGAERQKQAANLTGS